MCTSRHLYCILVQAYIVRHIHLPPIIMSTWSQVCDHCHRHRRSCLRRPNSAIRIVYVHNAFTPKVSIVTSLSVRPSVTEQEKAHYSLLLITSVHKYFVACLYINTCARSKKPYTVMTSRHTDVVERFPSKFAGHVIYCSYSFG
jgi:hypothetical protein